MFGALETHFKLLDFIKVLLFNATTEEQKEQARHLLELAKKQEFNLDI